MDWELYRNYLLDSIPSAKKASGGSVINCRCMECPDSRDPKSAHMYISIPFENDKPSLYYCHKCNCSGIVTHNTLIRWGLYDKDIALMINEYNNDLSHTSKGVKYFTPKTFKISNNYTTLSDKTEEKRKYISDRVGHDLSLEDLNQLKICVNLIDLLEENNIQKLTRDRNIVNELDREFIGFISIDNAFLCMRRTCQSGIVRPEIDKRYINYKIHDKIETSERFYTIPCTIDMTVPKRIKLHLAEGPFDILSVYLNLRNKEPGIYSAVSGNNYINIILYFLEKVQLPYIELHFYTDNDRYGTVDRVNKIIDRIPDKTIPVYIHKNNYPGEKDFGVPLDHINESIMRLR